VPVIDNLDSNITTTIHLPCIVDNVCILPVDSCGNPDCHCLPPEQAISACVSPSGTVVVPTTTCHPYREDRPQWSPSRDAVLVIECIPYHDSLIIDEEISLVLDFLVELH